MSRQNSSETTSIKDRRNSEFDQSAMLSTKKFKPMILTDKEKAEEERKIQEFYQSKCEPVEDWSLVYENEEMVDGTDVDHHVEKNRAIKILHSDPEEDE